MLSASAIGRQYPRDDLSILLKKIFAVIPRSEGDEESAVSLGFVNCGGRNDN